MNSRCSFGHPREPPTHHSSSLGFVNEAGSSSSPYLSDSELPDAQGTNPSISSNALALVFATSYGGQSDSALHSGKGHSTARLPTSTKVVLDRLNGLTIQARSQTVPIV
jgi:hypothetical protein